MSQERFDRLATRGAIGWYDTPARRSPIARLIGGTALAALVLAAFYAWLIATGVT
jgi:hypothetical protein